MNPTTSNNNTTSPTNNDKIELKKIQIPEFIEINNRYRGCKVGDIESIYYIRDYITVEEEKQLLSSIYLPENADKWTQLKRRRLQNWGGTPVNSGMKEEPLPHWLDKICLKVYESDILPQKPNHVLLNEYCYNQGIMPHKDGPLFYPCVTILSMGSTCVMDFYKNLTSEPVQKLFLEPRSLLVFTNDAYKLYYHGISESYFDVITDKVVNINDNDSKQEIGNEIEREVYKLVYNTRNGCKQIPGPTPLPIIGNLHQLGKQPHRSIFAMTKKYGHFFRVWMGDRYAVFVSDPKLVRDIWVNNFDSFNSIPKTPTSTVISFGFKGLTFSEGERWKYLRSITASAFSMLKIKTLATTIVENQTTNLINQMKHYSDNKKIYNPFRFNKKFSMNIILNYVFSENIPWDEGVYEGNVNRLAGPIDELFKSFRIGRLGDQVKVLQKPWYYYQKFRGHPVHVVHKFIREIYQEHMNTIDFNNPRDLMDSMIIELKNKGMDTQTAIYVGMNLILAGTDTSSTSITWFMLLMANNPHVQEKIYDEINEVFKNGSDTIDCILPKHMNKLPYLNATIKEVMRLKPVTPFGLSKICREDVQLESGYYIPAGTQVLQNTFGLCYSSDYWVDPESFKPERFLGSETHNDYFLPFSVGPRHCIGLNLAKEEIFSACGNIILNFKINRVSDQLIDENGGKPIPGPIPLPIIGNLHQLGKQPHRSVFEMTKKYGHCIRLWIGDSYSIFISDPKLVREIWVENFNFINSVPQTPTIRIVSNEYKGLTYTSGKRWKSIRSITSSAFSILKIKTLASSIVEKQTKHLIYQMFEHSSNKKKYNPLLYNKKYSMNVILNYVFSEEISWDQSVFEGEMLEIIKSVDKVFVSLGVGFIGDQLRILNKPWYIYQKLKGPPIDRITRFVSRIYQSHLETINPRDLLDSIIIELNKNEIDPEVAIYISNNLFLPATNTVSTTLNWFMLLMANHPEIQDKIYQEIEKEIVPNPDESEKSFISNKEMKNLPYLNATIKEVMRYKTFTPFGLSKCCLEDFQTESGFFIPKGAHVFQNVFALSHSPNYWEEPEKFNPDRFLNGDSKNINEYFIPFSIGPRNCLGLNLAKEELFSACANILFHFKISRTSKQFLDEYENYGITLFPQHLELFLDPRKNN
eukprot:gene3648-4545_t